MHFAGSRWLSDVGSVAVTEMDALKPSKEGVDIGFVTVDFPAMREFYVDVLGLEYIEQLAIPWGLMHRLRFGVSWLKLVEPHVAPTSTVEPGLDAAAGLRYITFEIENIDAVWGRAMAAGADVFHDLGPFGTRGITMGMLFDPDGNVVELLRRP